LLGFSPWEHLDDEGTKGILTTALVGPRAAWFGRVTVDRGGGWSFSMGHCSEHGEWEFAPNSNRAAEKNRKLFFFQNLFQGNGIQIKSFEYFQTKFELD
jgi:hypothetical protein